MSVEANDVIKLAEDARSGVDGAFEKLYESSLDYACGIVSLYIGNQDDISDVLQNVFIRVYKGLPKLNSPENYMNWLARITRNECIRFIEKDTKQKRTAIRFAEWSDIRFEDGDNGFDESEELKNEIKTAIDSLKPIYRECVVLYYYECLSVSEISAQTGVSEGTVKSRLYNARRKLEKLLSDKTEEKLDGAAIMSLIAAFLRNSAEKAEVTRILKAGLPTAAEIIGSAAASSVAEAGASAVAGGTVSSAAGAAGTAAVIKTAAVISAVTIVIGGGAAAAYVREKHKESPNPEQGIVEDYTEPVGSRAYTYFSEPFDESGTTVIDTVSGTVILSASAGEEKTDMTGVSGTASSQVGSSAVMSTAATEPAGTTARQTTVSQTAETTAAQTKAATSAKETSAATTAAQRNPEEGFSASGGVLNGYSGAGGAVKIPSSVNSETVTAVGAKAFYANGSVTSVSVPSSVTRIGQLAFADCGSLTSASLPQGLKEIDIGAFSGCTALKSVNIPSTVTTIGDEAFADCGSLTSVTIPSGVTSIGEYAFDGCDSLTIRCTAGSAAQDYAEENSLSYELI